MQPRGDQPQFAGPPGYAGPVPAVAVTRSRPWLVALAATGTLFVLILAVGNPTVTRKIFQHAAQSQGFGTRALQSFTTFGWDLSPAHDVDHLILAGVLADVAVLVVTLLLVALVTRGRGSFWQVFAASWTAVVVAVMIGAYVRPLLINSSTFAQGRSKAEFVFFSQFSPGAGELFAGLVAGLVVALVAALVALATRRTEMIEAHSPSAASVPGDAAPRREAWTAPPAPVPGRMANPSPWTGESDDRTMSFDRPIGDDAQQTRQLPSVGDDAEHTQAMPRTEPGEGGHA
jgi:hypothetical protein